MSVFGTPEVLETSTEFGAEEKRVILIQWNDQLQQQLTADDESMLRADALEGRARKLSYSASVSAAPVDWPTYNRTLTSQRFAPLSAINVDTAPASPYRGWTLCDKCYGTEFRDGPPPKGTLEDDRYQRPDGPFK